MGKISTIYKLSKESGVEVKDKVAPGIGYEKMQIDNLDNQNYERAKNIYKKFKNFNI